MQKSKCKSEKQGRSRRGLSIIELLVVMSILTLLASIGVTTYSGVTSRNRVKTAKHVMASFRTALEAYKTHYGEYPCETDVNNVYLDPSCTCTPPPPCGSTCTGTVCKDFYHRLAPYLSGDYGRYFNTSTFNYKTSVIDSTNLNVPTRYTISVSAKVQDPSFITATHKALEATLNGEVIR